MVQLNRKRNMEIQGSLKNYFGAQGAKEMTERLMTGIAELDEMLQGGFLEKDAVMVAGSAGTGKTTLALQYIANGIAKYGENGIYVAFEQFPDQIYRDASAMAFGVADTSARSYLRSGVPTFLLLGCGVLTFGTSSLFAAWLIGPAGTNVNVTVFDIGALAAALLHAGGATSAWVGASPHNVPNLRGRLLLSYVSAIAFSLLQTAAALLGVVPTFFVQGVGPTLLRQIVLGGAIALFAFSSVIFMRIYTRSKSDVLYWYSLALALIAVGLALVFIQKAVGSPIGLSGRIGQYLGGVYLLASVLVSLRAKGKGGPSPDEDCAA